MTNPELEQLAEGVLETLRKVTTSTIATQREREHLQWSYRSPTHVVVIRVVRR